MTEPSAQKSEQLPAGGPPAIDATSDRRAVNRELAHAWRAIETTRAFLWMFSAGGTLLALLAHGVWSAAFGVVALAMAAGAFLVKRQPFLWSLVAAVAVTLAATLQWLLWGHVLVEAALVMIVVAVWIAVPRLRRAERLIAERPDAFGARRIRGAPRRKAAGKSDES